MINKVAYSLLKPESLIILAKESVKTITNNHPNEQLLNKSLLRLQENIQEAEKAVGKTQKETLTFYAYRSRQ